MRTERVSVDRVMAEARAASFTRRSIKAASKEEGLRLALSMLDLTTLEGKDSREKVRSLCRKAVRVYERDEEALGVRLPSVAAVCVYPSMVGFAKEALEGSGVKVASVATGFPSGQYPLKVRLADVESAIRAGADEVDMVVNRGAFLSGAYAVFQREIRAVQDVCVGQGVHLKVILETGELETYDHVRLASDLAIEACCDADGNPRGAFIKTSTGKVSPAATMPVTLVMLEAIRDHFLRTGYEVGMKPAGGIRTAKQALHYLVMVKETMSDLRGAGEGGGCAWLSPGLFRFGASALLNDILRQLVKLRTSGYAASYDFAEA